MKIDRLIGILSILLQRDRVTAPYLAEKFEVSRRTIERDIEDLCKAGIPIVTTRGAGGGVSIMDGFRMDRTLLTKGEMQAILTGLRSLDSVSGTRRYERLMEKLSAGASTPPSAGGHILIDLAAWSKPSISEKLEAIDDAIETGRIIHFHYFSPDGESERTVEPYYLIFQWSSWYVWGWCRTRRDFRLFRLQRMTGLGVGGRFERRYVPLPDLSAETVFPDRYHVKAVMRPEYRWRLIEEYGPESFVEQNDGTLLFSFGFTNKEAVVRYIASFGGGAELLEPAELRADMAAFAEDLRKKYV